MKQPRFSPPELITQYCTVSSVTCTPESASSASGLVAKSHGSAFAPPRSSEAYALVEGEADADGVAEADGDAFDLPEADGDGDAASVAPDVAPASVTQ